MELGIESLSPTMLKIMRKTDNPEKYISNFREISDYCNEKEVMHWINLLFNHPGETRITVDETLDCLKEHISRRNNIFCFTAEYTFMLFPGSHVYEHMDYYKKEFGTNILYPAWWKYPVDAHYFSAAVVPSRDISIENIDYWKSGFSELEETIKEKLDDRVFELVVYNFKPYWKEESNRR